MANLKNQCIDAVFRYGLNFFEDIVCHINNKTTQEDLETVARYAITYFGVSSSKLALVTGGNPETNNLFPDDSHLSEKQRSRKYIGIKAFLQQELQATREKLAADWQG